MTETPFRLTPHSSKWAASVNPPDFVFAVGESEYECCRFQACCLSQRVCRLLKMDSTMNRLCLDITDQEKQFASIFDLVNGGEIKITNENMEFVSQCACELENEELISRIAHLKLENEEVSMSNVVWRIHTKQKYHMDYQSEVEFLASNFFGVTLELLTALSLDEIEDILSEKELKLKSEDWLYDLILSLAVEKGADYMLLLRHVQFMFLSEENLDHFLDRIYPDLLDERMWISIRQLLREFNGLETKSLLFPGARYHIEEFPLLTLWDISCKPGIFGHLREKCGGNPHLQGIITMTSKNQTDPECHCLIDEKPKVWQSYGSEDTFIQFDFKQMHVNLISCCLKVSGSRPREMLLEGSDNGKKWDKLARRSFEGMQCMYRSEYHLNIAQKDRRFHRYIRLTQKGENRGGSYEFVLGRIEFYGELVG